MPSSVVADELDLSVLLAARDAAGELPLMLGSLAQQSFDGTWEVLVVDNGSTDATAEVARSYAGVLPRLRVLPAPDAPNKAAALNQALPAVRGRVIVTVDADDSLEPGYLQAMADALGRSDLVGARLEVARVNPPHLLARRRPMQVDGVGTFMRFAPAVVGAAMGVRTDALREVGGFDPTLQRLSDMDVSLRLHEHGASVGFAPDAVVHYRYRDGLAATFWQEVHYAETEAVLYRKHRAAGMPRRRVRSTVAAWVRLLLAVPGARTAGGRYRLATQAGAAFGRVRGSVRERVLYF